MSLMLEFEVEVPAEMAEEFDKKLAYIAEGIESAIYDPDRRRVRVRLGEGKVTSQEVLEARVSEIAQKLRSGYQPGIRRQLAHRVRRSREVRSDPHPLLVANGDLHEFGRGRFGLGPKLVALVRALDELIVNRFSDMNPRAHQFPSLISGEVLDRCRYLRNFPASLTMVAHLREDLAVLQDFASQVRWNEDHLQVPPESASPFSVLLAPSVCFHWYAWLGNRQVEGPSVVTALGKCFRYESTTLSGLERLWDFSMREVVFVGDPDWIATSRDSALRQGQQVVEDLDLDFEIATASDPFFIDAYSSQAMYQRGFELKYELLCPLGYRERQLAVGSVNYHQDFFGRALNIEYAGSPCHTACIGFGLERLALAVLAQHGTEPSGWPATLQDSIGRLA